MITTLFAGTLASILHVISGPDHLAAVTPLVIESQKKAWKIGLSWGLGHVTSMLLIGFLFFFLESKLPFDKISENSEQLVGYVLIGIGIWAIYTMFRKQKKHKHPHFHLDDKPYIHVHKHQHDSQNTSHNHQHEKAINQTILSSFSVGILHGLAGIAHFLLLLPILDFATKLDSIYYIVGFVIGTIIAMTSYAIILRKLATLAKGEHDDRFFNGIRLAGGLFAIIIGVYWIFYI